MERYADIPVDKIAVDSPYWHWESMGDNYRKEILRRARMAGSDVPDDVAQLSWRDVPEKYKFILKNFLTGDTTIVESEDPLKYLDPDQRVIVQQMNTQFEVTALDP